MTEQNKATEQEFLFAAMGEIVNRIERCGASIELTHAVSLASDLRQAIGNQFNPANSYALDRVKKEIGFYPVCNGKNCGATDGISHSFECAEEHDECYREDNLDRAARRNHIMIHGSEY